MGKQFTCPVCGYDKLREVPKSSFEICPCCYTEFGYEDATLSHAELRKEWIANGSQFYGKDVLTRKQIENRPPFVRLEQ